MTLPPCSIFVISKGGENNVVDATPKLRVLRRAHLASLIPLHHHYTTTAKAASIHQPILAVCVRPAHIYAASSVTVVWEVFPVDDGGPPRQRGVRAMYPRGWGTRALEVDVCLGLPVVGGVRVQLGVTLNDDCPRPIDNLLIAVKACGYREGWTMGQSRD